MESRNSSELVKHNNSIERKIQIVHHQYRYSLNKVLHSLSEVELENDTNFSLLVVNIMYIHTINNSLELLKKAELVSQENILSFLQVFAKEPNNSVHILHCLLYLSKAKLATQINYSSLIQDQGKHLFSLFVGIWQLSANKILTQTALDFITRNNKHATATKTYIYLSKNALATNKIIGLLNTQILDYCSLNICFDLFKKNRLETKENYITVVKHAKYAEQLAFLLSMKMNNPQIHFDRLILYRDFLENIFSLFLDQHRKEKPVSQELMDSTIFNINKQIIEERTAFFMGGHPKLGAKSSLLSFFKNPICDKKNITMQIFDFLPKQRKSITMNNPTNPKRKI